MFWQHACLMVYYLLKFYLKFKYHVFVRNGFFSPARLVSVAMKYYFCERKLYKELLIFLEYSLRSTLYFIATPYFILCSGNKVYRARWILMLLILLKNWSQVAYVIDERPRKIVLFQVNNKYTKVTLVTCWLLC